MTGSKLRRKYDKAIYSHSVYSTFMQTITRNARLNESQAGIKIARRNIESLRYADGRKQKGTKEPFDGGKRGEGKSWLKTQHLKN